MRGDLSFNAKDMEAVLVLACTPRVRSVEVQDRLVRVCTAVDALLRREGIRRMAVFAELAGRTWEGRPCRCGASIPVTAEACGPCRRQAAAVSLVDPDCTVIAGDAGHRCLTRDGDPIRAGQACWTTARQQARGGS